MTTTKALISRELRRRRERIRGRIASDPYFIQVDPAGQQFQTLVADLDLGKSGRVLEAVPIKRFNESRSYATAGSGVFAERDARGRLEIVGPCDRVVRGGRKCVWNRAANTVSTELTGNDIVRADFLDHFFTVLPSDPQGRTRIDIIIDGEGNTNEFDMLALVVQPRS